MKEQSVVSLTSESRGHRHQIVRSGKWLRLAVISMGIWPVKFFYVFYFALLPALCSFAGILPCHQLLLSRDHYPQITFCLVNYFSLSISRSSNKEKKNIDLFKKHSPPPPKSILFPTAFQWVMSVARLWTTFLPSFRPLMSSHFE